MPPRSKTPPESAAIALARIEATPWAIDFKEDSPVSYPAAIRFAADPSLRVEIVRTNSPGDLQWAIIAASHDPNFWMDVTAQKSEAEAICRRMGWRKLR